MTPDRAERATGWQSTATSQPAHNREQNTLHPRSISGNLSACGTYDGCGPWRQ